jgi:tetratricopeptide (TPR) repeat protein
MYKDANRLDKAEIEYNAILQPASTVLGAKNSEYAEILADIGDISFARKKYEKAIEQYEQYIAITKGLTGKVTDKDLYPVYLNLGDAYRFTKNYDKAVVNYNESLRIAEGDIEDTQLLESYSTISRYFNEMDKEADAEKLLEKKRELIKKTKGNRSIEYVQNSIDLSEVYIRSNQLLKAKEKLEHALEACKEMGKDKDPIYAVVLDQLGKVAEKESKREEAEKFYVQALEQRKVSLKGKENDLAKYMDSLAFFYQYDAKYNKADSVFKASMEIRKRNPGVKHPDYASSLDNIGKLLILQGKFKDGETLLKQASQIYFSYYGGRSNEYANNQLQMAEIYRNVKNYPEALKMYRKVLDLLNKGDAKYAEVQQQIATLTEEMNKK